MRTVTHRLFLHKDGGVIKLGKSEMTEGLVQGHVDVGGIHTKAENQTIINNNNNNNNNVKTVLSRQ